NIDGLRNGIRTTYSDPLRGTEYAIIYKLNERHEQVDKQFRTISFYLGDDKMMNTHPDFYFYANVKVFNSLNPTDTNFIFLQCSPLIKNLQWDYPYLKVPISPANRGNDYFNKYIIEMADILEQ